MTGNIGNQTETALWHIAVCCMLHPFGCAYAMGTLHDTASPPLNSSGWPRQGSVEGPSSDDTPASVG
jgi:hypothetical protein